MKVTHFRIVIFLMTFWFVLPSCAQEPQQLKISSVEQFKEWSSKPLYQKYGQVSSVKVVFDARSKELHFISSRDYTYHYEFCMAELGFPSDLGKFNRENYHAEPTRRFLLANVNYYSAIQTYTLELGPSDRMSVEQLELLYDEVKKSSYFGKELKLMLNTAHVINIAGESKVMQLITPEEIYAGQTYQPISKKKSKGKVRIIEDWEAEKDSIHPSDIIVIQDIPLVFPLVKGVVVIDFQTPLSHVSLLGQNRGIPICAYTKAFQSDYLLGLDGKTVEFVVEQDTFLFAEKSFDIDDTDRSVKRIKLDKNCEVDSLIPIQFIKEKHSEIMGNKAANFGELYRYSKKIEFKTPESAFAIPFHYYDHHVRQNGIQEVINEFLAKDNQHRLASEIENDLALIRKLIKQSMLDESLLREVEKMIIRLGDFRRMRFRSSTNAEDREGFSGAGIYTSKTGELGNPNKPIDKAIKKVWASLWTYNAFMEREAFNMDHSTVAMGILVHRSFPDEAVNGVAITTNLYRDDYLGFVVNAQLGDVSVVQPDSDIECDQFICFPDRTVSAYSDSDGGVDIINYSSLNNGELVMTYEEIQQLANVLEQIKRKYLRSHYAKTSYFNFGLDIEFKLDKDSRALYIKQMRIYNR